VPKRDLQTRLLFGQTFVTLVVNLSGKGLLRKAKILAILKDLKKNKNLPLKI